MLRRAANNAYSWWWASHVRTKQSKWLEENLQDIEEKVQYALKLLEDEGDSFAKRAEMYYKRRPELISFVEEAFKAYRALAERYDHISKELQNANTTIASVFPEQVPEFAMNEDQDALPGSPRNQKTRRDVNIPKVPDLPMKDPVAAKMIRSRIKEQASTVVNKSGLSKTKAVEEIDKLQKEILALQTEKEFVKSSYENALAKYWEIENRIMEQQERVCSLQDEFDENVVIENEEAQILMSTTALKSCQEKLDELKDIQEKNVKESDITRNQIRELSNGEMEHEKVIEEKNLESLKEKVNEELESEASSCRTVTDVADKIDELVNDVIDLENLFSSQAALIHRLREEVEDLKAQIRALQKEKNSSKTDKSNVLRNKPRETEEKLKGIKDLDQTVEEQSDNIEKQLTRAHAKLSFLSERLKSLKKGGEEDSKATNVSIQDAGSLTETDFTEFLDDSVVSEDVLGMESASEMIVAENDEANKEETIETTEKEEASLEKPILSPKSDIETEVIVSEKDESNQEEKEEASLEKQILSPKSDIETEVIIAEKDKANQEEMVRTTEKEEASLEKPILSPKSDIKTEVVTSEKDEANQEEKIKTTDREEASLEKPILSPKSDIDTEEFLQKFLAHGIEGREKHLLTEYTKVLRNYKEVKKILNETETKCKSENTMKDEQIRALNYKINLLQRGANDGDDHQKLKPKDEQPKDQLFMLICKEDNALNTITGQRQILSPGERQFEAGVDALLSENLNLMVRFSNSLGQIQQFDTGIKDLQVEILKIIKQKNQDGGGNSLKSNVRPIYKHLSEIRTEMTVWLEKSLLLKEEINIRASTLRDIQDEIAEALKTGSAETEKKFTIYQGAKFGGEVSNMKKENNRISEELQAGLDQVTKLQKEVDKTLEKLSEEFSLSGLKNRSIKARIPLRSFIFDNKPKKQRLSLFSCIQPSLQKKIQPSLHKKIKHGS